MLLLLSGERLRRGVLMLGLLGPIEFHQLPVLLIQQHLNSSNADISEPDACWILLSPIWKGKPLIRSVISLCVFHSFFARLAVTGNHESLTDFGQNAPWEDQGQAGLLVEFVVWSRIPVQTILWLNIARCHQIQSQHRFLPPLSSLFSVIGWSEGRSEVFVGSVVTLYWLSAIARDLGWPMRGHYCHLSGQSEAQIGVIKHGATEWTSWWQVCRLIMVLCKLILWVRGQGPSVTKAGARSLMWLGNQVEANITFFIFRSARTSRRN